MKAEHKQFLIDESYDADNFLLFNRQLTSMARKIPGNEISCVDIDDPVSVQKLGPGFSLVSKKFAEHSGLFEAYKEFMGNGQQSVPPVKTFGAKVEQVKNAITPATPEEAFEKPSGPPPPPSAAQLVATPARTPSKEDSPVEGPEFDLTRYEGRLKYIATFGYVSNSKYGGYVNEAQTRWLDENIVKTLNDPAAFTKFVIQRNSIEWKKPEPEIKPSADLPDMVPGAIKEIAAVSPNIIIGSVPKVDFMESQEAIEETQDVEEQKAPMTKDEKFEAFLEIGFPYDKKKKSFQLSGGLGMSLDAIYNVPDSGWEDFLATTQKDFAKTLKIYRDKAEIALQKEEAAKKEAVDKSVDKNSEPATPVEVTEDGLDDDSTGLNDENGKEVKFVPKKIIETNTEKEKIPIVGERPDNVKKKIEEFIVPSEIHTNFFSRLLSYKFHTVTIAMTRIDGERIMLTLKPESRLEDRAFLELQPMILKGRAEDFDKTFFSEVDRPLTAVSNLFARSDQYLKDLKKAEKEAKMNKDKEEKLKKAVEELDKYVKGDKQTKVTLTKRIEAVLDLDSENKEANKQKDKLSQGGFDFK